MSRQIAQTYFTSCPFCEYREMFSSESAMKRRYVAHLYAHERRGAKNGLPEGDGLGCVLRRLADHVRRLEAAPYN
jgi:hypothetical protein